MKKNEQKIKIAIGTLMGGALIEVINLIIETMKGWI